MFKKNIALHIIPLLGILNFNMVCGIDDPLSYTPHSHTSHSHAHYHPQLGGISHGHSHQLHGAHGHGSHGHGSSHGHSSPAQLYIPNDEASRSLLLEAGLRDGVSVLEIGCGPGIMTPWLAQATPSGKVTAFDTNDSYVAITQEKCCSYPHVSVLQRSVFDLQEEEEAYDIAYCRLVLHHIDNPALALRKVVTRLKPGGSLICEDFLSFPLRDIMKSLGLEIIIEKSCPSAGRDQLPVHREAMGFPVHSLGELDHIPLGSFRQVVGRTVHG